MLSTDSGSDKRRLAGVIALMQCRMVLRKGKIVEAAGVQRSGGAGEKEEILGIRTEEIKILLCPPAPLPLCNPYTAYPSA
jgi:hypothetical protein